MRVSDSTRVDVFAGEMELIVVQLQAQIVAVVSSVVRQEPTVHKMTMYSVLEACRYTLKRLDPRPEIT